jgi:hypothetical protein
MWKIIFLSFGWYHKYFSPIIRNQPKIIQIYIYNKKFRKKKLFDFFWVIVFFFFLTCPHKRGEGDSN